MTAIDLFVPTRKRPGNLRRLLASIRDTASDANRLTTWLYVDEDDTETPPAIPELRRDFPTLRLPCCVGTRLTLAHTYNVLYAHSGAPIMFSGADDIVFRTPGWDAEIDKEFAAVPDQILLVYGDDLLQRERLCTHAFISRRAAEICGYFYPNIEGVSLTDIWFFHMYRNLRRLTFRPDIVIEHMHWLRNLAPMDDTYAQQQDWEFATASLQQYADQLMRDTRRVATQLTPSPTA